MIRLQNVRKTFDNGASYAVSDTSFSVEKGELLGLIGESGCGKTTTLKMINRLEDPSNGSIFIADQNVMDSQPELLRRNIGYVFQGIGLFPHYTVAENVAAVPGLLQWDEEKTSAREAHMNHSIYFIDQNSCPMTYLNQNTTSRFCEYMKSLSDDSDSIVEVTFW